MLLQATIAGIFEQWHFVAVHLANNWQTTLKKNVCFFFGCLFVLIRFLELKEILWLICFPHKFNRWSKASKQGFDSTGHWEFYSRTKVVQHFKKNNNLSHSVFCRKFNPLQRKIRQKFKVFFFPFYPPNSGLWTCLQLICPLICFVHLIVYYFLGGLVCFSPQVL